MMGFHTGLDGGGRGVHDSSSPGPDCSVRSPGTPGGGLCPVEVLGYGRPLSNTEALTHSALIPGGLPALHRRVVWQERRGVIRPRVQGRPTAFTRPQVLRAHQNGDAVLGTAPAPAPFWLRCSTSQYETDQVITNGSQTMPREASHHQVRGRTAIRANQSREGAPRPDVARRAGRMVGNQFGRRVRTAEGRVGFLPAVHGGVSASERR